MVVFCLCSFSLQKKDEPALSRVNALLFLAGLIGLIGLVGTQTRAAFAGLFVCGCVALIQGVRQRKYFGQNRMSTAKGFLVLALVTGLLTSMKLPTNAAA